MANDLVAQVTTKESSEPSAPGWQLMKTRDFRLLYAGQLISQIGDGLNKVALLWFVYELTGSALKMMVVGLLQTIPPLLFGPLIGVYLDRLSKKKVMIWVDLLRTFLIDEVCNNNNQRAPLAVCGNILERMRIRRLDHFRLD